LALKVLVIGCFVEVYEESIQQPMTANMRICGKSLVKTQPKSVNFLIGAKDTLLHMHKQSIEVSKWETSIDL
jgi:hypothetical protein